MPSNSITRCDHWYELNLAALNFREMSKAAGPFAAALLYGATFLNRIFSMPMRGGVLIPEEVTLMWEVPHDEVELPPELADLGFELLDCFELPEFSGENVTCLLHDAAATTYCEVVYVRNDQGHQASGLTLSTYFLAPLSSLKTVQAWKASPLDRPPGYAIQQVSGSLAMAYEAHCNQVRLMPGKPLTTAFETYSRRCAEDHKVFCRHYRERDVYVDARPAQVETLLRRKGLGRR